MIYDYFGLPHFLRDSIDIKFPRYSGKPIVKAENLNQQSRSAKRQQAREQNRKWEIKYK